MCKIIHCTEYLYDRNFDLININYLRIEQTTEYVIDSIKLNGNIIYKLGDEILVYIDNYFVKRHINKVVEYVNK